MNLRYTKNFAIGWITADNIANRTEDRTISRSSTAPPNIHPMMLFRSIVKTNPNGEDNNLPAFSFSITSG